MVLSLPVEPSGLRLAVLPGVEPDERSVRTASYSERSATTGSTRAARRAGR